METTSRPDDLTPTREAVNAFAERVLSASLGATETFSIFLGDRLGWYRTLAETGPVTPRKLADLSRTNERYAREWLEQQAAFGIVTCDEEPGSRRRRFTLPPAAAEVLTDPSSLAFLAPLARMFGAAAAQLPALVEAYRTGGGVSWEQFGDDARESQADLNRPWYEQRLADALAGVPSVHESLARPGACIADIGCGAGWSTIALARAYPGATVVGFDVDLPSIDAARANAAAAGLADRVQFVHADAAALPPQTFDAAFAFECVHDLPYPVRVLAAAAEALRPGGCVIVMDEAVGEQFAPPSDYTERLMYGFSLLVCLPDGMSHRDSAGTGTVMRRATLAAYGQQAGLSRLDILPIDDFGFWRFYRLRR